MDTGGGTAGNASTEKAWKRKDRYQGRTSSSSAVPYQVHRQLTLVGDDIDFDGGVTPGVEDLGT